MWDAIVVGGRCAGAATALGLARRGAKVLVLDRATFPSDTLSTHFLWPRGCSYLQRLGLLDAVLARTPASREILFARDGIAFRASTPVADVAARLAQVHGDGAGAVDTCVSVRRTVLDALVLDAARAAGVEVRTGVNVTDLQSDGPRTTGVAGTMGSARFREQGRFVIGADGRQSRIAQLVGADVSAVNEDATFAYWTYFSGVPLPGAVMEKRGRLAAVVVATNDGANMTLVFGPKPWWSRFRTDRERYYHQAIAFVNRELGERVRAGKQEEQFYGIADQRSFKRTAAGPGWLLVGDAACIKDQCTAIGMTHAFRDAELAAAAVLAALGGQDERAAMARYRDAREADLAGYYEFVGRMSAMTLATPEDLRFMRCLETQRPHADAFASMYGDAMRVDDFVTGVRPAVLAGAPPARPDDQPAPSGEEIFA